jgi:hypothetical protein
VGLPINRWSLSGGAVLLTWIVVIGTTIWIAAVQLSIEAEKQLADTGVTRDLHWLPVLLGVAPIFTAALSQLQSIPEMPTASGSMMEVGSIVRIQASELEANAIRFKAMAAYWPWPASFSASLPGLSARAPNR